VWFLDLKFLTEPAAMMEELQIHHTWERVAQLVEHVTFNHGVVGSSPTALTNKLKYLACESPRKDQLGNRWGINADELCIDFDLRSERPRSHGQYRAYVLLAARVQCRWAGRQELRQSGARRAILIFLPAKVTFYQSSGGSLTTSEIGAAKRPTL
jgi:hypothetical protein